MRRSCRLRAADIGVVVLLCALLAMVLVPAGLHARGREAEMVCLMNVRGLAQAWTLYHEDNDGWLVGGSTYYSGGRATPYRWVEPPLYNDTDNPGAPPEGLSSPVPGYYQFTREYRLNGIRAGKLFPYTGNVALYHCPADKTVLNKEPYALYRSYSMPGLMNSEDFLSGTRVGWPGYVPETGWRTIQMPDGEREALQLAQKWQDSRSPAKKYAFVEEEAAQHGQAFSAGGFVLMSNGYYWSWWDWPAPYHGDRGVQGFADGHVGLRAWTDPRTIALINQEPLPGTSTIPGVYQVNNPDLEYMNRGYMACD